MLNGPLNPGDVILIDAGVYPDSAVFTAAANGVFVRGSPREPAIMNGFVGQFGSANVDAESPHAE